MNFPFAIVNYAREIFDDSSEEEEIIEKVDRYAEYTVPHLNVKQFKAHFRMETQTFEDLVEKANRVYTQNNLNPSNVGHPRISIEKELMVTMWYLGNLESFR